MSDLRVLYEQFETEHYESNCGPDMREAFEAGYLSGKTKTDSTIAAILEEVKAYQEAYPEAHLLLPRIKQIISGK
jgi:hypothetical protein